MKFVDYVARCIIIAALIVCMIYIVRTEAIVVAWENRVKSVGYIEDINLNLANSHEYGNEVLNMAQELARLNLELVERERLNWRIEKMEETITILTETLRKVNEEARDKDESV